MEAAAQQIPDLRLELTALSSFRDGVGDDADEAESDLFDRNESWNVEPETESASLFGEDSD